MGPTDPSRHAVVADLRFRGSADVLPTKRGLDDVAVLARRVADAGGFDDIYHDNQWRTLLTALVYHAEMPKARLVNVGYAGQSQALGGLEGQPVNDMTIAQVQYYTEHPDVRPEGVSPYATRLADTFNEWLERWLLVVEWLQLEAADGKRVGIVTHNRNIHALSSLGPFGTIDPDKMNQSGPAPNTIHMYEDGQVREWGGEWLRPAVYFVRHAETSWNR